MLQCGLMLPAHLLINLTFALKQIRHGLEKIPAFTFACYTKKALN